VPALRPPPPEMWFLVLDFGSTALGHALGLGKHAQAAPFSVQTAPKLHLRVLDFGVDQYQQA